MGVNTGWTSAQPQPRGMQQAEGLQGTSTPHASTPFTLPASPSGMLATPMSMKPLLSPEQASLSFFPFGPTGGTAPTLSPEAPPTTAAPAAGMQGARAPHAALSASSALQPLVASPPSLPPLRLRPPPATPALGSMQHGKAGAPVLEPAEPQVARGGDTAAAHASAAASQAARSAPLEPILRTLQLLGSRANEERVGDRQPASHQPRRPAALPPLPPHLLPVNRTPFPGSSPRSPAVRAATVTTGRPSSKGRQPAAHSPGTGPLPMALAAGSAGSAPGQGAAQLSGSSPPPRLPQPGRLAAAAPLQIVTAQQLEMLSWHPRSQQLQQPEPHITLPRRRQQQAAPAAQPGPRAELEQVNQLPLQFEHQPGQQQQDGQQGVAVARPAWDACSAAASPTGWQRAAPARLAPGKVLMARATPTGSVVKPLFAAQQANAPFRYVFGEHLQYNPLASEQPEEAGGASSPSVATPPTSPAYARCKVQQGMEGEPGQPASPAAAAAGVTDRAARAGGKHSRPQKAAKRRGDAAAAAGEVDANQAEVAPFAVTPPPQGDSSKPFSMRSMRYKGVYRMPTGRWRAQFTYRNKVIQVGMYDTEEEAARAWDKAAIQYRGAGTKINLPVPQAVIQEWLKHKPIGWCLFYDDNDQPLPQPLAGQALIAKQKEVAHKAAEAKKAEKEAAAAAKRRSAEGKGGGAANKGGRATAKPSGLSKAEGVDAKGSDAGRQASRAAPAVQGGRPAKEAAAAQALKGAALTGGRRGAAPSLAAPAGVGGLTRRPLAALPSSDEAVSTASSTADAASPAARAGADATPQPPGAATPRSKPPPPANVRLQLPGPVRALAAALASPTQPEPAALRAPPPAPVRTLPLSAAHAKGRIPPLQPPPQQAYTLPVTSGGGAPGGLVARHGVTAGRPGWTPAPARPLPPQWPPQGWRDAPHTVVQLGAPLVVRPAWLPQQPVLVPPPAQQAQQAQLRQQDRVRQARQHQAVQTRHTARRQQQHKLGEGDGEPPPPAKRQRQAAHALPASLLDFELSPEAEAAASNPAALAEQRAQRAARRAAARSGASAGRNARPQKRNLVPSLIAAAEAAQEQECAAAAAASAPAGRPRRAASITRTGSTASAFDQAAALLQLNASAAGRSPTPPAADDAASPRSPGSARPAHRQRKKPAQASRDAAPPAPGAKRQRRGSLPP